MCFAIGRIDRDRVLHGGKRRPVIAETFAHERQRHQREDGGFAVRVEPDRSFAIRNGFRGTAELVIGDRAIDVEHGIIRIGCEADPASIDRRCVGTVGVAETRGLDVVDQAKGGRKRRPARSQRGPAAVATVLKRVLRLYASS